MRIIINNTWMTDYMYYWKLADTLIYIKIKKDSNSLSYPNHFNRMDFLK